jgi:hypothetical protein
VVAVRDLLLVTNSGAGDFEEFRDHPPTGSPAFDLGREPHIERTSGPEAEL